MAQGLVWGLPGVLRGPGVAEPIGGSLMDKKSMLLTCGMTVLAVAGATLTTTSPAAAAGRPAVTAPAPSVTVVGPDAGERTGGTRVSVQGANFTSVDAVLFGTTPGTDVTVSSDTSLTVTAPAHAAGIVDLKVVAGGGTREGPPRTGSPSAR